MTYPGSGGGFGTLNRSSKTGTHPCPCGYAGVLNRCTCDPGSVARYLSEVSGPLWDRIDLRVEVGPVEYDDMKAGRGESTTAVRKRVEEATVFARARGQFIPNGRLTDRRLAKVCQVDSAGHSLLKNAVQKMAVTARGIDRIKRIARSIADLDASARVLPAHLSEAIQFRVSRG